MAAVDVLAVQQHPLPAFVPDEVDGDVSAKPLKSRSVGRLDSRSRCGQSDRAVHGAGIEMDIAECLGQKLAQSTLARPRRGRLWR